MRDMGGDLGDVCIVVPSRDLDRKSSQITSDWLAIGSHHPNCQSHYPVLPQFYSFPNA
jgi:hypothetical protein